MMSHHSPNVPVLGATLELLESKLNDFKTTRRDPVGFDLNTHQHQQ